MEAPEKRRWYRPTPGWLVLGSLAVTGLIWLSNWLEWPAWHKGYAVLAAVAGVGVVLAAMLLWWLAALAFRWRFQFSLRSLLVLTLAVALPCSWLAVEMRNAKEQRRVVETIWNLTGRTGYDWEVDESGYNMPNAAPREPEWLRKLLGFDFFEEVRSVDLTFVSQAADAEVVLLSRLKNLRRLILDTTQTTDTGLEQLAHWPRLEELSLDETQVTDAALAHISGLTELRRLYLNDTQVKDVGLVHLARVAQLQILCLDRTQVTDAGLAQVAGLSQLRGLSLKGTHITDRGLTALVGLARLRVLALDNTHVTDEGVTKLQLALPNCRIAR